MTHEDRLPTEQLVLAPRRSPSPQKRRLVVVAAIAMLALAGLLSLWLASPQFSDSQIRSVYQRPPPLGLVWGKPIALPPRPSAGSWSVDLLGLDSCQDAVPAVLGQRTSWALDGYSAQFRSRESSTWGVSSTARYRDAATADADFEAINTSLAACELLALPSRYGSMAVTIHPEPAPRTLLNRKQVRYRLDSTADGATRTSWLTGMQLGNSISWQTYETDGPAATVSEADRLSKALFARLRSA